ncbi:hypothetical protein D3C75_390550 [compost metagenome]
MMRMFSTKGEARKVHHEGAEQFLRGASNKLEGIRAKLKCCSRDTGLETTDVWDREWMV